MVSNAIRMICSLYHQQTGLQRRPTALKSYPKPLVFAFITLCSACGKSGGGGGGSGDGISGIYAVSSQTKNTDNCDTEGPADASAPAFYRIFPVSEIFPGASGWSSQRCDTVATCSGDTIDLGAFSFESGNGQTWNGESVATGSGGGNCSITVTASTAGKQADGSLAIELRRFTGVFQIAAEDCDPESGKIAEKRSELTCSSLTRITATAAK